eukprot:TRINITY_DN2264_c0_g3_i4.p1 TRINITY_DN2264_c0_g3~~TRINITY_DN2264_c0_g3_i4.p1  ORF type:complete len:504 (+),score=111.93 TRINITY_DN2264_c0_g3_i4:96-1607(+)
MGEGTMSYMTMKVNSEARQIEEKRQEERRKNIIILILNHLSEFGYLDSLERLEAESGVSLSKYEVADNVDLVTIIQDYEHYFENRFMKKPRLTRKLAASEEGSRKPGGKRASSHKPLPSIGSKTKVSDDESLELPQVGAKPPLPKSSSAKDGAKPQGKTVTLKPTAPKDAPPGNPDTPRMGASSPSAQTDSPLGIQGASLSKPAAKTKDSGKKDDDDNFYERRLLKPMSHFYGDPERKHLAETISRDIYSENPNVKWDDICGLNDAKRLLKEAIVMPLRYPQLFTGLLSPWKGVLLFGPPGTGKTMLAKAVATECNTTFFNISASTIVSKWRGDSEKLVRTLFELARYHSPSTIFLDEIDSLMSSRESDGEHEGSRRMKTELLIQMDGLIRSEDLVFVLAASNLPWDLDAALLRRLEKRILVDLPNPLARQKMFEHYLPPAKSASLDYEALGMKTEGYSGSDIKLLCKESAMRPLRKIMARLENLDPDHVQEKGNLSLPFHLI